MTLEDLTTIERKMEKLSRFSESVVDHCMVEWILENFLFSDVDDLIFESPKFNLARSLSSWYLLLSPQYENDTCIIFLHRDHEDDGPRIVDVSLRFGLKDGDKVEWQEEINRDIQKGTFEVGFLENASKQFDINRKQITVVCQIIVSAEVFTSVQQNLPTDASELIFLMDFFNLYKTKNLSDITLRVAGTDLKAHKAIIASRSAVFENMLSGENTDLSVLELSEVNLRDVNDMLLYLYTTNLNLYLAKCWISFSSYDCIEKFAITDLKDLLAPSEVKIVTKFVVDINTFEWGIQKFSHFYKSAGELNPNYCLEVGLRRFRFYIDCSHQNEYVMLMVECLDFDSHMTMYLEISLLKADGERTKLPKVIETKKEFGIPLFLNNELYLSPESDILPDDVLTLFCSIKTSNYDARDEIINKQDNIISQNKTASFESLLESGNYSDLALISSHHTFRVHKAVLVARSVHFKELLEDFKEDIVYIDDLSPRALRTLLLYIYSGKLEDDLDSAFEIYKVSDKYAVTALGPDIQYFFGSKFNPREVCNFALKADLYTMDELRTQAIKSIALDLDIIGMSSLWNYIVKTNKKLATEVLSIYENTDNKSASIENYSRETVIDI